jgi:Protein of unknown function (DUF3341)
MAKRPIYGVMAEFETSKDVLEAARRARDAGYREMDAYSPFPVEGLSEAIGFPRTWLPAITLAGGLLGCFTGFFLQYFPNVIGFPLDIGGKPFDSWPSFIPITFELTILFAGVSTVVGMIWLNRLPTPYHPVFNVPRFELASQDRFFLCIKSKDPRFSVEGVRRFFEDLEPREVNIVPV